MVRLLTIGTFDTPHIGHAAFLRRCERFADEVVVGVNTDRFVSTFKNPPLFSFAERCELVGHLGYRVLENDGPGRDLILDVQPTVLAIGSDWARKPYLEQIGMTQDELDTLEAALVYIPYTPGISSTEIKFRCLR